MLNLFYRTDTVPEKGLLEKGKSSLTTIEPLIGPDLEKQKTGVDSLLSFTPNSKAFRIPQQNWQSWVVQQP
jgi:hypothetical protein